MSNGAPTPTETPKSAPHAYQPTGVPRWRTCALCGRGANASIHKLKKEG